ncbi:MAG: restriction endonuclease subunit S [Proteobacteria bacterium]|nr:restriction endonuclease subunit S [Pseudomonadota bacterium]
MKLKKDKWENVILNEICDVRDGTHDSPKYHNEGYPLITSKNITGGFIDFSETNLISENDYIQINKRSLVDNGDILLSMIGTVGIPVLVDKKIDFAIKNVGLIKFAKQDTIYNRYLLNVLQSDMFQRQIQAKTSGTAQKFISLGLIRSLQIPLPPLEEQKQIAALFQSIETAIEQVEGQEKNLLTLKNQMLRELLGETQRFGNLLSENDFDKVKFEKLAFSISERVEPQKTTLDTYVGLEHLDPDNLIIARTGKPGDVIGTKLTIYKGDIIFGKRRAYQRKVAVSHFDGIASAHSMILRANEKHIEKEFLPFFMQSDVFMNRAVQISEGSLSPTIKWKTLATQEFLLPKKEKQKGLTAVFKQFDNTRGHLKQQKTTLKNLKQKLLSEILG